MSLISMVPSVDKVSKRIENIIYNNDLTDRQKERLNEIYEAYKKLYIVVEKKEQKTNEWRTGNGKSKYNEYMRNYYQKKKEERRKEEEERENHEWLKEHLKSLCNEDSDNED